jgi:hypothetical protein
MCPWTHISEISKRCHWATYRIHENPRWPPLVQIEGSKLAQDHARRMVLVSIPMFWHTRNSMEPLSTMSNYVHMAKIQNGCQFSPRNSLTRAIRCISAKKQFSQAKCPNRSRLFIWSPYQNLSLKLFKIVFLHVVGQGDQYAGSCWVLYENCSLKG